VAVAGVTLAASGDSLAAYAALFADTATLLVPWSVLGIGLGATAWSVLAVRLSGRPAVRSAVDRTGPVLLPLVLIGIGLYILGDTPTDVLSPP
jgi:cadmium resistance protein CadD (predicted permease)